MTHKQLTIHNPKTLHNSTTYSFSDGKLPKARAALAEFQKLQGPDRVAAYSETKALLAQFGTEIRRTVETGSGRYVDEIWADSDTVFRTDLTTNLTTPL